MFKSKQYCSNSKLKNSTCYGSESRRTKEGRQSEPALSSNDGTLHRMPNSIYHSNNNIKQQLHTSNRISRNNSGRTAKSTEKQLNTKVVQKMLTQLKSQYPQSNWTPQNNKLTRVKSEQNFQSTSAINEPINKFKNSIEQIQQKISQYSKINQLRQGRSQEKILGLTKSPEKNIKLNEKSEKCRQLCLEIKRKLFKETVSTTNTESVKKKLTISDFILGKMIGEGKFSKVFIARHKMSGIVLAIKMIKKQTIKRQNFMEQLIRQIKIQSYFNHVNIVKLYSYFHDRLNIYLLLEYCTGGQLYDIFKVKSKLTEDEWHPIMRGICQGLYELHLNSVIHRDIKPENIVLSFGIPKIGDFGWSVHNTHDKRQTFCGTPLYISPQLLLGNSYDKEVDIWALGVMMYQFLTGRIPFKIQHERNLLEIVNSNIVFPKFLGEQCQELLKMILEKDATTRIGILDILEHRFMSRQNARLTSKVATLIR